MSELGLCAMEVVMMMTIYPPFSGGKRSAAFKGFDDENVIRNVRSEMVYKAIAKMCSGGLDFLHNGVNSQDRIMHLDVIECIGFGKVYKRRIICLAYIESKES
ncbi:hypothetical protein L1987_64785 [Smallanthus sonchifolius]|uniref:Uncharacterized protein n=1 Tax=Smallanthus sonchifolius TaxID=185202 RepID=A0ACB9BSN9_9ASTR|nr:hypothetical protein L1987_64785 [Smallanthus sonchifolius]